MHDHYSQLALTIGIKVLFVLAVCTSLMYTYQILVVSGEYEVIESPDGPDMSDFEAP